MSISSRPDQFFQPDSVLDEASRKARKSCNGFGNPVKLLFKLLVVIPDPSQPAAVYVGGSVGVVKRVLLAKGDIPHTYRGPKAPLTCLALSTDGSRIYAGCWDKLIWSWDVSTCAVGPRLRGHIDFVKSLLSFRTAMGKDLLISGGAEGHILIWDLATNERLAVLQGRSRAVQHVVLDPLQAENRLFVAFSSPEIKHLTLSDQDLTENPSFSSPIFAHETTVHRLEFDSDGDLWTASADKTAKRLVRVDEWKPDINLVHADFVRDIVIHERYGWAITACRDEEVRVWNIATGKLHHVFSGHFDEVTGLCLIGDKVVSVSIDGTIRQWSLHPQDLNTAREEAADPTKAEGNSTKRSDGPTILTEEEEAELAALIDDPE